MERIHQWRTIKEAIAEKKTSPTRKNRKRLSGRDCEPKNAALEQELMESVTTRIAKRNIYTNNESVKMQLKKCVCGL